jgi:hypothetical protein
MNSSLNSKQQHPSVSQAQWKLAFHIIVVSVCVCVDKWKSTLLAIFSVQKVHNWFNHQEQPTHLPQRL